MKKIIFSLLIILTSLLIFNFSVYATDDETDTNLTWTDFSKAECKIENSDTRTSILSISNVTKNANSSYYFFITDKNTKPSVNFEDLSSENYLPYTENTFSKDVSSYVELNQDLYLWVLEKQLTDSGWQYNYVINGIELDRPEYPKYYNVFFATMLSYDASQIVFKVPWGDHTRKINLKIGKIDDVSILKNIKNNESDAFEKLLAYSKKADTIYNKQLTSSKFDELHYDNGYVSDNGVELIDLKNLLKDESYYFMYAELDDENGKYYPVEGITIAQASVYTDNSWYMFFLGDDNLKWNLSEDVDKVTGENNEKPKDDTTATSIIPYAGNKALIFFVSISSLIVLAIIGKSKYQKYKDIK